MARSNNPPLLSPRESLLARLITAGRRLGRVAAALRTGDLLDTGVDAFAALDGAVMAVLEYEQPIRPRGRYAYEERREFAFERFGIDYEDWQVLGPNRNYDRYLQTSRFRFHPLAEHEAIRGFYLSRRGFLRVLR